MPFFNYKPTCLLVSTKAWSSGIITFPETKILGLSVLRRMRALVYLASRDKVDVVAFHKSIQYTLEKLGKSKVGFERTAVYNFKSKSHEGSGNELVDSRAPCLGADQKARVGSGNEIACSEAVRLSWTYVGDEGRQEKRGRTCNVFRR